MDDQERKNRIVADTKNAVDEVQRDFPGASAGMMAHVAAMAATEAALSNRIKANEIILDQTKTVPRYEVCDIASSIGKLLDDIDYNLASVSTPDQFYQACSDRGECPDTLARDGWIWVDNGAALESEDYAAFAWERDGDDFIFRGQVRLMGGKDFVY